ncbi:MAG: hypothetical protein HQ518_21565 [Rhodopirellula sp.]|nr:hypothetical protein [Rhodopirellula sp.]
MTLDVSKPIRRTGPGGNRPADGTAVSGSNGGRAGGDEVRGDVTREGTPVVEGSGSISGSGESGTACSFGG